MQLSSNRLLRYAAITLILVGVFAASLIWYVDINSFEDFRMLISKNSSLNFWKKFKAHQNEQNKTKVKNSLEYESPKSATRDMSSYDKLSVGLSSFNIKGYDVIVFLHIQNTGGSVFARHMIEDLILERPCRCKVNRRICHCYRPNNYGSPWLFSRYTTGWKCGVHPDWLELSSCIDRAMDEAEGKPVKRRYFFITVLRDPIKRFLSEFLHMRRGQNLHSSSYRCNGLESSPIEQPTCFDEDNIEDLTIEDFMDCPYNLAMNRQTRMLSDLSLVGCYNSTLPKEDQELIMLASAKTNLHKMSFFGLSEFPKVSQYMFETTFGLNFKAKAEPIHEPFFRSLRKELFKEISVKEMDRIKHLNPLDLELYRYAKELLFYRFEKLKNNDPAFENNFEIIGNNKLSTEDWAEKEDSFDITSK